MRITILSAGAWGTALAIVLTQRHNVMLWGRNTSIIHQATVERVNKNYLNGYHLPISLKLTANFETAITHIDQSLKDSLLIIASSVCGLRALLKKLYYYKIPNIVLLCKGLEERTCLLPHQIVQEILGKKQSIAILSGPSFAQEVAQGLPCALTVASKNRSICNHVVNAIHGKNIRVYSSKDLIGVEVGGAVKNVLAIATGISDGLRLGQNARAALITRGLAEITRFGIALGGKTETFMGLSGIGDLILTCTGNLSRNRQVGINLAKHKKLSVIVTELGHVAEGVSCARAVHTLAHKLKVDMPITDAVVHILFNNASVKKIIESLLTRNPQNEN